MKNTTSYNTGIVSLFFGGVLGYLTGVRGFIVQERFRDRQKKIEVLRDFLGSPAEKMVGVVHANIDLSRMNEEQIKELRTEIASIHEQVDRVKPYFINDEEIYKALTYMGNFMGAKLGGIQADSITAGAFEKFFDFWKLIKERLRELETELYSPPWWQFWK